MNKQEMQERNDKIVAICSTGKTSSEIRRELGKDIDHRVIKRLVTIGRLYTAGIPPNIRYWNKPPSTEAHLVAIQNKTGSVKNAAVIWPDHIKVQVCPSGEDNRFKFVPPSKDWVGEITKDRRKLGMCK